MIKALKHKDVIKISFGEKDPFFDLPYILDSIDKKCKSGEMEDMVLVLRTKDSVNTIWRGNGPMTTALGMLEYGKARILAQCGILEND